jgi:hypothetical protein
MLVVLVLPAVPVRAAAQEPVPAARLADAKELFRRGVTLLSAGELEPALQAFLRSRDLVPSGKNTTDAAICLERLGRFDEALALYEEVLTRFAGDLDQDDRRSLEPVIASLRQKIGYLELSSNVDGLVVVDGRARGRLPLGTLRLMPGKHSLRVLKPGYESFERTLDVQRGVSQSLAADLVPLAGSGEARVDTTDGSRVEVFIDGKSAGMTPVQRTIPSGQHVLWTQGANGGSAPELVRVEEKKRMQVQVTPQPLGGEVWLSVRPGAGALFVGGVPLGRTAWHARLPQGSYEVSARAPGFFEGRSTISAPPAGTTLRSHLELRRNPSDRRWPAPLRFFTGVAVGPWLAPSLDSGAEQQCPSQCAGSRAAWGGFGVLRGGVRHESGVEGELRVGYLAFEQRFSRTSSESFGTPPVRATFALSETADGSGPLLEGRAGIRRMTGLGIEYSAMLGLGALFGSYNARVSGQAFATGNERAAVASSGAGSTTEVAPFVSTAVGGERSFGSVHVRAALALWFFPATGPELGGPKIGVAASPCEPSEAPGSIRCAPDSEALRGERAHGRFWALSPELGLDYVF